MLEGEELAAPRPVAAGEVADEILVGAAQQVHPVAPAEDVLGEEIDQPRDLVHLQRAVGVNARQHPLQLGRVALLQQLHGVVQPQLDVAGAGMAADEVPRGLVRHHQHVLALVLHRVVEDLLIDDGIASVVFAALIAQQQLELLVALLVAQGQVAQEQQRQHVVLVVGRRHGAAQGHRCLPQLTLEVDIGLRTHGLGIPSLLWRASFRLGRGRWVVDVGIAPNVGGGVCLFASKSQDSRKKSFSIM